MNESISGLGALGFWLFLGILAVAIAWAIVRIVQIRHETLARIAERGQSLDKDLLEKFLSVKPIKEEKPYDPIRAGNEGAGFFFMIGIATVFVGIIWKGGLSYPIIGLGVFLIVWANWVWYSIGKEVKRHEKQIAERLDEAP
jgi:Flp pilus assembly protein TadB